MTLRELVEFICRISGKKPRIVTDPGKPEGRGIKAADSTRLRAAYPGFRVKRQPRRGLAADARLVSRHIRAGGMSQQSMPRIGPADAEIVMFNKGGRDFRYERLQRGEETPREFFYGLFDLQKAGLSAAMMSSSGRAPGAFGAAVDAVERVSALTSNFGARPLSARLRLADIGKAKVVISYTDGFSLSVGLARPSGPRRPIVIGGFHGLSDTEKRVAPWARPFARALIRRSLARLDHVFFFGPADREFAIETYGLRATARRSSASASTPNSGGRCRMWPRTTSSSRLARTSIATTSCSAAAPGQHRTIIVTRQAIKLPAGRKPCHHHGRRFFRFRLDERRRHAPALQPRARRDRAAQGRLSAVRLQRDLAGDELRPAGRPDQNTRAMGARASHRRRELPAGAARRCGRARRRHRPAAVRPGAAERIGRAARETVTRHFGLDRIGPGHGRARPARPLAVGRAHRQAGRLGRKHVVKVAIGSKPYDGPWGGGNRFVSALCEALAERGHEVVHELDDADIDFILMIDPRVRSPNVCFGAGAILRYLAFRNPNAIVIHRINECDERKNEPFINHKLVRANYVADATVFVGEWLTRLPVWRQHLRSPWFVMRNGADTRIFNAAGYRPWTGEGPLKLVTHHWGYHPMKGFDVYAALDLT